MQANRSNLIEGGIGVPAGLKEYFRYDATKVSLFPVPPNVELPLHHTDRGEMFHTLRSGSELILRDGTALDVGYEKVP